MSYKITWEYIAGFFDGEGCIFFKEYPNIKGGKSKMMIIHIGQGFENEKESGIIKEIYEFLKEHDILCRFTHDSIYRKDGTTLRKNTYYRVTSSSAHACKSWLEYMLPFLRVKKKQANEAIVFMNSMKNKKSLAIRKIWSIN